MQITTALMSIGLALAWLPLAHGGQAQATDTVTAPSASAARYTTVAGDTLEKIATRQYAGSPLQLAWLVRHLHEANAGVLGKVSPRQRLKVGMQLWVPEHTRLVQLTLAPHLPVVQEQAAKPDHQAPETRRRWVHYP